MDVGAGAGTTVRTSGSSIPTSANERSDAASTPSPPLIASSTPSVASLMLSVSMSEGVATWEVSTLIDSLASTRPCATIAWLSVQVEIRSTSTVLGRECGREQERTRIVGESGQSGWPFQSYLRPLAPC